jgi:hypothetical protein
MKDNYVIQSTVNRINKKIKLPDEYVYASDNQLFCTSTIDVQKQETEQRQYVTIVYDNNIIQQESYTSQKLIYIYTLIQLAR